MDVKRADDPRLWDKRLCAYVYPPFTQLWAWGDAQERLGKHVVRYWTEGSHGWMLTQWIQEARGPLRYWLAPQGPVIPEGTTEEELCAFVEGCRALLPGARARVLFDRIEPRVRSTERIIEEPPAFVFGKRVRSLNPATSFLVCLEGTIDDIFERMHKKTRYNIRLAERHAVIVRGGTAEDIPVFLRLMHETAERDEFLGHDPGYLRTIVETLTRSGHGRLRIAECLGKPLAANLEVLCGDTVMYLYGASSSEDREKMAPYALQWSAVFAARQEGFRWYDFGGGNPEHEYDADYKPSWEGITRFKERWGTLRARESGTYDLPRQSWLYRLLMRR